MAEIDDALTAALATLPPKPGDEAPQAAKKRYSELVSQQVALALGTELRRRGLKEARPGAGTETGAGAGAERRMAGGLGAKKVDVTWATEESGLLLGISVKTINFRDSKTRNFQKNLVNRRGDMLMEAVTLHRRFPYAVLAGLFFLDSEAANDGTDKRRSTFLNAHARLQLFTGRNDPADREEQFERFYLILLDSGQTGAAPETAAPPPPTPPTPAGQTDDLFATAPLVAATPLTPSPLVGEGRGGGGTPLLRPFQVGTPDRELALGDILDDLLALVAQRNPDFYELRDGRLIPA
ncbi:hypothetical protein [uncultured Thiodictyon sp.]|uniref:hypothetical protein n=1 Tax=uncultured Thiodictyon sp. TaxID=1846217 RepID=UPI0025D41313|nr:hypothetical protein [uncultured Thiodictyon sp.]